MQLIGVIDLAKGRAVQARAGRRETYQPVENFAGEPIDPGDALALARAYVERAGISELYVADLDAIAAALADAPPDDRLGTDATGPQDALVAAIAALGAPLWLDAGVSSPVRARHAITLGAARVIVGLETLASYDRLKRTCDAVGGDRVAFSLDLRDGEPILASRGIPPGEPPEILAARAADMGAGAVIVLDLARVGTGAGLDLTVIERVRASTPGVTLLAGGGVRGLADLRRLADAGCDGALVAMALQTGALRAADVAAARHYRSVSGGSAD
jgi:phosphoribosylformimino-5-aminoimidazole carboxamide ribotide isomerase